MTLWKKTDFNGKVRSDNAVTSNKTKHVEVKGK